MALEKSNGNTVQDLITTGFDSYLALKYNVPPILTMLSQSSQAVTVIQEEFRNSKFVRFFRQLNASQQQTNDHYERLGDKKDEFLKSLLLNLERLDDERKADLVGKLYNQLIKEQFKTDLFRRMANVIDRTYYNDLAFFLSIASKKSASEFNRLMNNERVEGEKMAVSSLVSVGLVDEISISKFDQNGTEYKITPLGEYFFDQTK